MRDLLKLPGDNPELNKASEIAHREGPIADILNAMQPDGYWEEPGPGYLPKYRSTVWSIILVAQSGASIALDPRIRLACQYLMEHAFNDTGQITTNGRPSGTVDCLQGNLCAALLDIGYEDPLLNSVFEWMARTVIGDGLAPFDEKNETLRYYAGKRGPGFVCGANNNLPCAWGAAKVMLAFSKLPDVERTPLTCLTLSPANRIRMGAGHWNTSIQAKPG
jgi:hypothetical protein